MAEPQAATQKPEPVDDRLRRLGWRAARAITQSDEWREAARWLDTLPHCQVTFETSDPNDPRVLVEVEDCPPHLRRYLYDYDEEWRSERGPVLVKLLDAWQAVSYRFVDRVRDRYYDFGNCDARRFLLLGALTLDRDFTGQGLLEKPMPWERKGEVWDGRGWAWAAVTSALGGEQLLVEFLKVSFEKLESMGDTRSLVASSPASSIVELVIYVDLDRASLDGHEHDLTDAQTTVLSQLADARGAWVPRKNLRKGRVDRIINRLPPPLLEVIESKKGTGYRIKPGVRATAIRGPLEGH